MLEMLLFVFKFEGLINFLPSIEAQLETPVRCIILNPTLPLDPLIH